MLYFTDPVGEKIFYNQVKVQGQLQNTTRFDLWQVKNLYVQA